MTRFRAALALLVLAGGCGWLLLWAGSPDGESAQTPDRALALLRQWWDSEATQRSLRAESFAAALDLLGLPHTAAEAEDPALQAALQRLPALPEERVALVDEQGRVVARRSTPAHRGDSLGSLGGLTRLRGGGGPSLSIERLGPDLLQTALAPLPAAEGTAPRGAVVVSRPLDLTLLRALSERCGQGLALSLGATLRASTWPEASAEQLRGALEEQAERPLGEAAALQLSLRHAGSTLTADALSLGTLGNDPLLLWVLPSAGPAAGPLPWRARLERLLRPPLAPRSLVALAALALLALLLPLGLERGLTAPCRRLARDLRDAQRSGVPLALARNDAAFLKPLVVELQVALRVRGPATERPLAAEGTSPPASPAEAATLQDSDGGLRG